LSSHNPETPASVNRDHVEKHGIDFLEFHKVHNLHALGRFDIRPPEILLEHHKFALFAFVPLHDLILRHPFAVGFGDALVIARMMIQKFFRLT
jgi:hypothetical protein